MRRWHHGHSIIGGAVLTLALERHALVFALLIFAAGMVAGRTWGLWLRVGDAARRYFTIRAANVRRRVVNARTSSDEIPF